MTERELIVIKAVAETRNWLWGASPSGYKDWDNDDNVMGCNFCDSEILGCSEVNINRISHSQDCPVRIAKGILRGENK